MMIAGSTLISNKTNPNNSDISTADSITHMRKLAHDGSRTRLVFSAVNSITSELSNQAKDCEIVSRAFFWVKDNITFETDEDMLEKELGYRVPDLGMELLKSPEILLLTRHGDCDDFSTLIVSILLNLGFRCRFVTVAADRQLPWKFSHVYVRVWLEDEKRWLALDCSHGNIPGWEYTPIFKSRDWEV